VGKTTTKGFTGKVAARKWALDEALRQDVPSFRLRNMHQTNWVVYFVPAVAERHGWDPQEALKRARQIVRETKKKHGW